MAGSCLAVCGQFQTFASRAASGQYRPNPQDPALGQRRLPDRAAGRHCVNLSRRYRSHLEACSNNTYHSQGAACHFEGGDLGRRALAFTDLGCVQPELKKGARMRRREILKGLAAASLLPALPLTGRVARARAGNLMQRVRPSDPGWPKPAEWAGLREAVGGNLIEPHALFAACETAPDGMACVDVEKSILNPFYMGDQPAGTNHRAGSMPGRPRRARMPSRRATPPMWRQR